MNIDVVAKELVKKLGKDWDRLSMAEKTVFRNIARGVMILSSDITSIEESNEPTRNSRSTGS